MSEKNINNYLQKVILFFGERLAIILFFVFVMGLLISGHATQVLSHEKETQNVKQENNWYQKGVTLPARYDEKLDIEYKLSSIEVTPTQTPIIIVSSSSNDIWEKLADCETHGNWGSNTGNGYYGGLQFSEGAWISTGGTGNPASVSKDEQIMRGKILQQRRGWSPWSNCSKKLNLL